MFGSKEKKEAKAAAKEEKQETKLAAKEEKKAVKEAKQAEADKKDFRGNYKDGFGRDGITKLAFSEMLQSNWEKDPSELENGAFVQFIYDWYKGNSPTGFTGKQKPLAKEVQYKEEIEIDGLFRYFSNRKGRMDDSDWLREFDPESEVVILYGDNGNGIRAFSKFMLTNLRFYRDGARSRKARDVILVNDSIPLISFKGEFEIKGMLGLTDFSLNGDPIISFEIEAKTDQRRISELLASFLRRHDELFPQRESTASPTIVESAPNPLDQIKKLKEMQEAGILSEEEFEEKKNKLMDQV